MQVIITDYECTVTMRPDGFRVDSDTHKIEIDFTVADALKAEMAKRCGPNELCYYDTDDYGSLTWACLSQLHRRSLSMAECLRDLARKEYKDAVTWVPAAYVAPDANVRLLNPRAEDEMPTA